MAERENKKSLKDRAQDVIQGLIEAVESVFPSPERELVPVRVVARPRPNRPLRGRRR